MKALHRSPLRGSALFISLIIAILAAIVLGSYLKLSSATADASQRSLYYQSALGLADAGIEQALWSLNTKTSNRWTGWSGSGSRTATFTFNLGQNSNSNTAKVWVESGNPVSATVIYTKGTAYPPGKGGGISRYIRAEVKKNGLFAYGLVGKLSVNFNGTGSIVNSYDSRNGAYGGTNIHDSGTVGVVSQNTGALNIGNGSIWGSANVGSSDTSGIANTGGNLGPFGTSGINAEYVHPDFNADYPEVSAPTPTTINVLASNIFSGTNIVTLPRTGDLANSDGVYYYSNAGLSLSGSSGTNAQKLLIAGKVVIIISGEQSLSVSGNGQISVLDQLAPQPDGTLQVYTNGNVSISGGGLDNQLDPSHFQLWSTFT